MAEKQSPAGDGPYGVSNVHFCHVCKKPLCRKNGKFGPFWSCTGYPECHVTLDDVDGKPSVDPDEHYCCPVCTRRMFRRTDRSGKTLWLCTGSSRGCKVILKDDRGRPETAYRCQACGRLLVQRHGKYGLFWGCSRYPECTQTYPDRNGKPDFDILPA
jgi:DNA topoisomerase-3